MERERIAVDPVVRAAGSHEGATCQQHLAVAAAVQVTAIDGLRAVEIGAAAELSAREHRVVALPAPAESVS